MTSSAPTGAGFNIFSIHVGMDRVGDTYPANFNWSLRGCEKDARTMRQVILDRCGDRLPVEPIILTNESARVADLKAEFLDVAALAKPGDLVFFTFSGHGAWIRALPGTATTGLPSEATGYSKPLWLHPTILLYDRMMMDDEWSAVWTAFVEGVRVVTMFDSCVSGTVAIGNFINNAFEKVWNAFREAHDVVDAALRDSRKPDLSTLEKPPESNIQIKDEERWPRTSPLEAIKEAYHEFRALYDSIEKKFSVPVKYHVIGLHYGACQDSQVAEEGPRGGYFTLAVQDILREAPMTFSYQQLFDALQQRLDDEGLKQTPTMVPFGIAAKDLTQQPIFGANSAPLT